ncbi:MAG: hypothetical protein ACYC3Q_01250 [Gemmatimonadaceae bacterium]
MTGRIGVGRWAWTLAPALLLAVGTACRPLKQGNAPPPALLVFHNDGTDQAAVYIAVSGVEFRRIGTVMPGRTDTLTVPVDLANHGTVNIVARILARSSVPQTGPVSIMPGEMYDVRLTMDQKILSFLPTR